MSEYWITLISVCLFGGLIQMLSPEGEVKGYVGLAVSLCLLLSVAAPLGELPDGGRLSELDELLEGVISEEDYDEIYDHYLVSEGENVAKTYMKAEILRAFSLEESELSLDAEFESVGSSCSPKTVTLYLHRTTLPVDPRALSAFVEERWGGSCGVVYRMGDRE